MHATDRICKWIIIFLGGWIFFQPYRTVWGQGNLLQNVTALAVDLKANDIAYDRKRNLIYATVRSEAGLPNGNHLVSIDPVTLLVVDRDFVGSEPNRLAISNDCRRVYIGIDGAASMRYFDLASGTLGPLRALSSFSQDPAVAADFAISPADATTVIVSSDDIGSSAAGNLEVFDDSGKIGGYNAVYGSGSIAFRNASTLVGYNNYTSGFELSRFDFDGTNPTLSQSVGGVISGYGVEIEVVDGVAFANNGQVADPISLILLGQFTGATGQLEASERDGLTYFLDQDVLTVYYNSFFLEADSVAIDTGFFLSETRRLIFAGKDRLAFVDDAGRVGVISQVPFLPPPFPRKDFVGTSGDDIVAFDPQAHQLSINGVIIDIAPEITIVHFDGLDGHDELTCLGLPNELDSAFFEDRFISVTGRSYLFSADNCETNEFVGDDYSDVAAFFDSPGIDRLVGAPQQTSLITELSTMTATNMASVFVHSIDGIDTATLTGSTANDNFNANLKTGNARLTGAGYSIVTFGFDKVTALALSGTNDSAVIVDSNLSDYFYAEANYSRFANVNKDFRTRGFDRVVARADNLGYDRAVLKHAGNSVLIQTPTSATITDIGYRNTAIRFESVKIQK